ncbi:NYN domain-containing protein [Helicobacter muridarum]|uniref:NYN domain n=1 Tax=Helicobacter muridarum TaxID=216 RepID=A0A377PTC4_9HELI|nr:NYN domain-containing protein [Helicobacter muridarum]TLE00057.1 NYN domain-containing protein [Helicobacter muridarum]STQ86096.1 NYN domain [Helicobacter muridarum]
MKKNVALFIDCDRIEVAFMSVIFDYFRNKEYNVCVKRAYVTKDTLNFWYDRLEKQHFKVVLGSSQSNSDLKFALDIAKAINTGKYDSIAIASNYREFSVLAGEIQSMGLESICFYQYSKGNEALLKRAYHTVYNLEPNREEDGELVEDFDDVLAALESAIEGLDSSVLGKRLSDS